WSLEVVSGDLLSLGIRAIPRCVHNLQQSVRTVRMSEHLSTILRNGRAIRTTVEQQ
ncbi:hypothetical protein AVEN_113632-1, partial [Araneus ventricosus]